MDTIREWFYVVTALTLFVVSLMRLKGPEARYFQIGFGLDFLMSLFFRIARGDVHLFYNLSYFVHIAVTALLVMGVLAIGKTSHEPVRDSWKYQGPPQLQFGGIGPLVTLLIAGIIASLIGTLVIFEGNRSEGEAGAVILIAGIIVLISAQIYFLMVVYRIWRFTIVESERVRLVPSIETPGIAIGYLFIPFYNFYWVFKVYGKISHDLNAIASAKKGNDKISGDLGMALAVVTVVSVIPVVGYVAGVIGLVLEVIFLRQTTRYCAFVSSLEPAASASVETG